jgi:Flp pilus assembly protein TadD
LRRYDEEQKPVKKKYVFVLIALLMVGAAYANSFESEFHFDDSHTVVDNPAIRSLRNIPRFFTDATTFSVLPANRTYRPVVSTTLALDYAMGHGYKPVWFHVGTFAVFVALLGLLLAMYAEVMERVAPGEATWWWALGTATWFGLHPAMAETVNYVIQRGDLYCTVGCVAGLVVWARWPGLRRWGLYLLPVAVALLSKPPAAVFPALLLFWVFFFEARGTTAERWKQSWMNAAPSVVAVGAVMWFESRMTPKTFTPSVIAPWDYRMTQPYVWLRYFGELLLPVHLNADTDLHAFGEVNARVIAGLVFVVAMVAAIICTARRKRMYPIAFGLLWFVVTQLPTSLYPLSEVENDHRMFFSFVGLMLAVVWSLRLAVEKWVSARWMLAERTKWLRTVAVGCAVLALCGYAWGVRVRNGVWRTDESLWKDDVEKSPKNGRGLMNYGVAQLDKGQYGEALRYFEKAQVYTPEYATLEIDLGVANDALGQGAEAEKHFQRAIALAPTDDLVHAFYGRWLMGQGRLEEATEQLRTAVALNPARQMQNGLLQVVMQKESEAKTQGAESTQAEVNEWINRSLALNQAGRYEESIAAAKEALRRNPRSAIAWNDLAAGSAALRRWDDAIGAARTAVALQPDFQLAKNNLAWAEEQKGLEHTKKQ